MSPNSKSGQYAFLHTGTRTMMRHGMWQELPIKCMPLDSKWKISAHFRHLDSAGNPSPCNSTIVGGPSALNEFGCPIFRVEVYDNSGANKYWRNMENDIKTPWITDQYNYYEHTFVMDTTLSARERFFIVAFGVMPNATYLVDDISVVPVL